MVDASALPPAFVSTLHDVHDDAAPWLAALPETLARLEALWQIRVTGLVPQLSYNLVAYAERADRTPCILKLSPPSDEMRREGEALSLYAGDRICRLLERDDAVSALLLGRITPGLPLQKVWTPEVDDTHTRVAAELMLRLWRPVPEPNSFRLLRSWAEALWETSGDAVPKALRERAQGVLLELDGTTEAVLLHADLHHGNILSATSEPYLAIDPKGVVGARGYEVGPFLLNPLPATAAQLTRFLPRRLAIFSELLGLSERELAAWGFVHAVLSACWSLEDHGTRDTRALEVAEALAPLS